MDSGAKKPKFSYYFYNPITYVGALLAFFILGCEILLFGLDFFSENPSVYLGLVTYLILPPFLILGLILIPIGMRWKRLQVARGRMEAQPKLLHIDPSKSTHRNAFMVFLIGSTIFLIMTMIGSYRAFQHTESVQFCGVTCHDLMKPEYTAYTQSPHARVKCVECHIGEGAGWYVRSKLSGMKQVFNTVEQKYPRPIPTPVHNLRPAKETCEQCHWPGKSFSAIELKRTYYPDDPSKSAPWSIRMLMHVSGQQKHDMGIHAHMYNNNDIFYAADDEKRQKISWVKSVGKSGQETIYTTKDSLYKQNPPPANKIRRMDCMDCHSRPAHNFSAPVPLVNRALNEGQISPNIPMIKAEAVDVLSKQYASDAQAVQEIRAVLLAYYKEKQAQYYIDHTEQIEDAVNAVISIYSHNFFPEMKARWDVYPNNIGHLISEGCFRCHDGEHASFQGAVISRDCKSCHTIIEQGTPDALQRSTEGLEFQHPFEDDGLWKTMNCTDCHTGS